MQTKKWPLLYVLGRLSVFYRGRRNETEKLICDRLSVFYRSRRKRCKRKSGLFSMFSVGFLFFTEVGETRQKNLFAIGFLCFNEDNARDANNKEVLCLFFLEALCFLPRSAKRDRKTYLRSAFCI